jgi:hypothetical protein
MSTEIIVALIAFAGTAIGTFGGILASSKLTNYRLSQLEDKVKVHNNLIERMTIAEQSLKSSWHEIKEIKDGLKGGKQRG